MLERKAFSQIIAELETGQVRGESRPDKRHLWKWAGLLFVEQRGIERVMPNERTDTSMLNIASMWLSANLTISTFVIGTLGPLVFELGFWDSVFTVLCCNIFCTLPVAFFATLGPKFGLRQVVISRYSFGWVGTWLIGCLNCISCIGWSTVNSIVGAQVLREIDGKFPYWAGIVVIAILSLVVALMGYKSVHTYEKYAIIPIFCIFLFIIVEVFKSGAFQTQPMGTGITEAGDVLSFGSAITGFGIGWAAFAADYNVMQPETRDPWKVFFATWAGILAALLFVQFIGVASAMAVLSTPRFRDAYGTNSIGGLVGEILKPLSGCLQKLSLALLAFSIISNNVPNNYSFALSMQVFGGPFLKTPRWLWTIVGGLVYIALAIPGSTRFETALENLLNMTAYWLSIYTVIITEEHFIFRQGGSGYHLDNWNDRSRLPIGFAALLALCCGIFGAILGMNQAWYTGIIAKHIGKNGGDIGFELAAMFAGIVYPIARVFERRKLGR